MFNINLNQAIPQFFRMMQQKNIQIPQNIQNDPNAITQYLMNNGKITQQQYNQAQQQYNQAAQMARQMNFGGGNNGR